MSDNNITTINNLKLINGDHILITVNPKIYSLDVVQSAAYILMDRAHVIIDGDPKEKILVELKPTNNKENLEKLGRDFNNELLNYAVYKIQAERTKNIREMIVKRALLTNLGEQTDSLLKQEKGEIPLEDEEAGECDVQLEDENIKLPEIENSNSQNFEDDSEGIMIPWGKNPSDKKGKKKNGSIY